MCKLCGEEKETVGHVFFHCPTAQLIWKLAPVRWEGVDQQVISVQDWWRDMVTARNMKKLDDRKEFFVYMLWHIWKHRNRWTFGSEKWTELEVVQGACNEWLEFKEEQPNVQHNRIWQARIDRKESWKAPEIEAVKLNVSSDCGSFGKEAVIGIVARGDDASLLQTWAVFQKSIMQPVIVEL